MSKIKKFRKASVVGLVTILLGITLSAAGCESDASTVSKNLSTAADQFEVQRKIIGVNGITDKVAFQVEGRCSIERDAGAILVTCKHGPDDFRKHYVGLGDNTYWVAEQMEPIKVSEYHTRILIKPTAILPDLDLHTK